MAQHADAQRVDERVAEVGRVEDRLATDVGQAEAVAVAADAGHDPGQHALGVGRVERAEAQRVHHGDRPGAHGEDVADDAADAGRGTLVGLDVRRVVVRLDLEGDGVALADVDRRRRSRRCRPASCPTRRRAASPAGSRRTAAGAPCWTCRSSARSTSRSTSPARCWSAGGRGSRGSAAYSSALRPSSAHGCSWSGSLAAMSTVSTVERRLRDGVESTRRPIGSRRATGASYPGWRLSWRPPQPPTIELQVCT